MERIERIIGRSCVLLFVVMSIGSCVKFDKRMAWAYRALHWTKLAGEVTDKGIATWQRAEIVRCLKAHGTKTPGYAKCIAKSLKITRKWTGCKKAEGGKYCKGGFALQLQKAQKGGLSSLETAWKAGKGDVTGAIKPALCTSYNFAKIAEAAGVKFGKADKTISTVLGLASGLCK